MPDIEQYSEPPITGNEQLDRYLLELHKRIFGISTQGGDLDDSNLSDDIPNRTTTESITSVWDFQAHPTGLIHDQINELLDDDHTQYVLADGSRAFTGDVQIGTNAIIGSDSQTRLGNNTTVPILPSLTTTERDALIPANGMVIYNSDTKQNESYENGVWGKSTGENNTASNVGVGGVGVFKQKTGNNLEFKSINAGSSKVTVVDDVANAEIDIDINQANIDHDSLLNFTSTEHFVESSIDHVNIQNVGTNTHTQIDTHIADTIDPHGTTLTQTTLNITGDLDVGGGAGIGNLGATTANTILDVAHSFTNTSGQRATIWGNLTADPTSSSTASYRAVRAMTTINTAQTYTKNVIGVYAMAKVAAGVAATHTGTSSANGLIGAYTTVDVADATISYAAGCFFDLPTVNTGTLTKGYGLRIGQASVGTGSITNLYGLYFPAISEATNNWDIYHNGTSPNIGIAKNGTLTWTDNAGNKLMALTDAGTTGDLEVTGNMKFGTHSLIGVETVTGYITITDSGGTLRKLAVVS